MPARKGQKRGNSRRGGQATEEPTASVRSSSVRANKNKANTPKDPTRTPVDDAKSETKTETVRTPVEADVSRELATTVPAAETVVDTAEKPKGEDAKSKSDEVKKTEMPTECAAKQELEVLNSIVNETRPRSADLRSLAIESWYHLHKRFEIARPTVSVKQNAKAPRAEPADFRSMSMESWKIVHDKFEGHVKELKEIKILEPPIEVVNVVAVPNVEDEVEVVTSLQQICQESFESGCCEGAAVTTGAGGESNGGSPEARAPAFSSGAVDAFAFMSDSIGRSTSSLLTGSAPGSTGDLSEDVKQRTCSVSVKFVCDSTKIGETLALVGSDPALGSWNTSCALKLKTTMQEWPVWCGEIPVPAEGAEFKLIIAASDGSVRWEPLENNRQWPVGGNFTNNRGTYGRFD